MYNNYCVALDLYEKPLVMSFFYFDFFSNFSTSSMRKWNLKLNSKFDYSKNQEPNYVFGFDS